MTRRRSGPPLIPGLRLILLAMLMLLAVGGFYRWLALKTPILQRQSATEP